jgi:hypothetical protein
MTGSIRRITKARRSPFSTRSAWPSIPTGTTPLATWNSYAAQYVAVYRYGLLLEEWTRKRRSLLRSVDGYADKMVEKEPLTEALFSPFRGDILDVRLAEALKRRAMGNSQTPATRNGPATRRKS